MALDPERAEEIFSAFGPVRCRRMFSGAGVYSGDVMFALEVRGVLYLKSDASGDPAFEQEGCEPFSYETKTGRRVITSFRRAPERLLEDSDEMAEWARRAFEVARERKTAKRKSQRRSSKSAQD